MPSGRPVFDVREIPFSRRGAWIDLSPVVGLHRRADDIHLVSHQTGMHAVLTLMPWLGESRVASTFRAEPAKLTWLCDTGARMEATFASESAIRIRGSGVALRVADAADELTPFTGVYFFEDPIDGSYVFTSYETGQRYRVSSLRGSLIPVGAESTGAHPRFVTTSDGEWEVILEETSTGQAPLRPRDTFDDSVERTSSEFDAYVRLVAPWRTAETPAADLAAYVLWSATVGPGGFLRRESLLMSKHWMDKVWSWDHCFNALALAPALPEAAIDQFLLPFDHQDEGGALPDSIAHSEVLYNFVKPPIHGWAFARMRERLAAPLARGVLEEVYERLSRWSRFWLDRRRVRGHSLPHYQHGNDSGWDNATIFDGGRMIESPDLAAFLILQFDELAAIAVELGRPDHHGWTAEAASMRRALLDDLHGDDGFFARGVTDRSPRGGGRSLLRLMPVVAGTRLPIGIQAQVAGDVRAHLTDWGLATEIPGTREYQGDGYWRGPIWAPSTLLIEDGLRRTGYADLADEISLRFRRLCEHAGFAENFDAQTGAGLRDRAYTWTASVYLVLARDAALRGQMIGA
jgi:hypothetical protein